jgi:hypothetical protein
MGRIECPGCVGVGVVCEDIVADGVGPRLRCAECNGTGFIPRCATCVKLITALRRIDALPSDLAGEAWAIARAAIAKAEGR